MSEAANTSYYLRHLEKWQAHSHPDLADSKPEDLFEAGFVERYQRLHEDLWWRVIRLHGTLYTLDQLKQFPFDYLYAPDGMEFWRLVIENFLDMAYLMLDGLVNDTGPDVHSIPKFRNEIAKGPWLDQRNRDLLNQTLKERKFDEAAKSIAKRVGEIRDYRIAHRVLDRKSGRLKDQLAGVSLDELRRLFDATHSLFGALSFGSAYCTLAGDLMPSTVGGKPTRTCLDEVLNAVLRDSYFVNEPEREAKWWPATREGMDPERLRVMNMLRKRIGLPEA
ncbi:MAG: hypothetical protein K8R91_02810 [Phycisphaerae bacterium]|nr:hypothetical protein [Phycisphaerae bacterium]